MKKLFNKFTSNSVAKSGAIVFAGTIVMNICAYIYHLLMGRLLGPVGYGELSSLFSLLYIVNVPLIVGQTVLVKFISGYKAKNEIGKTKSLLFQVTKYFIIASLIGLPVAVVCAPAVVGFLHLNSPILFILVYGMLAFSLLGIAMSSVLQGFQMFIWSSGLGAGAMVLRLVISVPMASWGVTGVMWAALLATIMIYALYFYPLKQIFTAKKEPVDIHLIDAIRFTIPTFVTLLGITSIYSTDIILVRHYFSAGEAGLYAALAVLGKIIFYASSAVTAVLFPVVAERTASGGNVKNIIYSSVGIVASISAGLSIIFFLFPEFIVHALFGNSFSGASGLLGLFGVFLGIFSIGNSLVMASLASGKTIVWVFTAIAALAQIIGISVFHQNIYSVILFNIAISAFLVLSTGVTLFRTHHAEI